MVRSFGEFGEGKFHANRHTFLAAIRYFTLDPISLLDAYRRHDTGTDRSPTVEC
jgi:hypothetical protein